MCMYSISLLLSFDLKTSSNESPLELMARTIFLERTNTSSSAQQAPCSRFGFQTYIHEGFLAHQTILP